MSAVINVAASDQNDVRWGSSNYGKCVDIYAPGVAIRSSMYYSDTATIVASGTSMACPHVSGVAALYLQANPSAVPEEVTHPQSLLQTYYSTLFMPNQPEIQMFPCSSEGFTIYYQSAAQS